MKTWQKPQLVVLVRGKPEEAILTTCKTGMGTNVSGPYWQRYGCVMTYEMIHDCDPVQCSAPANS